MSAYKETIADFLAVEFENFYKNTIFPKNILPRLFSAVRHDRRQFLIDFDQLQLESQSRRQFIIYLCNFENIIGYVYATPTLMVDENGTEELALEIIASDLVKNLIITQTIEKSEDGIKILGRRATLLTKDDSWLPYTNLISEKAEKSDSHFEELWLNIKDKIHWVR